MILVDTSVWIDHWCSRELHLIELLRDEEVLAHPMVIGELACGHIRRRQETMRVLNRLPRAPMAGHLEALRFIEQRQLMGRGIGYVDIHLLASAMLGAATPLWTVDRRLRAVAEEFGLAYEPVISG
jgi:predicted nucleic acid-binding protein